MFNEQGTEFKILSDGVLDKLKSSGIPDISEEEFDEMIYSHIRSACVRFKACKKSLSRDNELQYFYESLDDSEIEILICLLTIEYISSNFINVPSLLRNQLTSKDFKIFSNSEMILRLTDLRDTYIKEVRQMISIYSNTDSELFTILKSKRNQSTESTSDETETE